MSEKIKKRRPYGSGSVYKRKNKYWIAYYEDGRLIREPVSLGKETAEKVLKTRQADIIRRKFKLPIMEKISFVEMGKKYLKWSKTNKKSWERDIYSMKNLVGFFGEHRLSQITPLLIEQYKEERKSTIRVSKVKKMKRKFSNAYINRDLALLKHLFTLAIKWGYVDQNPVKEVKFLREDLKERILKPEEIQKLLDEANDGLRPVIITALNTGMRLGEMLSLKWHQVNLQAGFIQIEHAKNGKMRKIPMNATLTELFENVKKEGSEYVFLRYGKPIRSVRTAWENALRRAGIQGCRFHDLRHTFATYALITGADLVSIRDILGHSDIRMTSRYAHSNDELKKRAVESISNLMDQNKKGGQIFTNYSQLSKRKEEDSPKLLNIMRAGVAKLADALDSKSSSPYGE